MQKYWSFLYREVGERIIKKASWGRESGGEKKSLPGFLHWASTHYLLLQIYPFRSKQNTFHLINLHLYHSDTEKIKSLQQTLLANFFWHANPYPFWFESVTCISSKSHASQKFDNNICIHQKLRSRLAKSCHKNIHFHKTQGINCNSNLQSREAAHFPEQINVRDTVCWSY